MSDSMHPSVAVLMSTYNGEKYLREQADSILNQRDVDVHLYVRDDGSTDTTLDIIREYIAANPGKISLMTGENLGPGRSFMELVYQSPDTYDYYAFSDQDDIWLEDKLMVAVRVLQESGKGLYTCNMMCIDSQSKNKQGLRNTAPLHISPYTIMGINGTHGCTMVFTRAFRSVLARKEHRPSDVLFTARFHDSWSAMVAAVLDTIVYDFDYHMLYRQHENNYTINYTGYDTKVDSIRKWLQIKRRKIKNKVKRNGRSKMAREIVRAFPEESAQFPYLALYAEPRKLSNKIKLIRSYKEYRGYGSQNFFCFCLYVCFNLI